jgi:3-oxoadipate enol-lactonase
LLHHDVTGSGPAVLLLHAGVADSRIWEPQWEPLAREFTVIRCDLPGFGRSPIPDAPWVTADEVVAVLDAAGVDRAAVVGNSYGGLVSLQLAARHPDRVERLILISPDFEGEPDAAFAAYSDAEEPFYEAGDIDGLTEHDIRAWVQPDVPDDRRAFVREMHRHSLEVQFEDLEAEPEDVEIDLAKIDMPVTIFTGARDFETFRRIGERLARDLPDATHVHLEWAGHLPGLERPEETTELLRASLARSR